MKNVLKKVKEFIRSHKFYKGVVIGAMAIFALDVIISLILGNLSRAFDNTLSFIWCWTAYNWYTLYYTLKNRYEPEVNYVNDDSDKKISPDNPF